MGKVSITPQRNLGVDFLRILSMYMVVILHILGQGGVLEHTSWLSGQYITAWGLEIAAYCAVNCFGLISGYVGYESKFRWSKLISLWLQVLFFSLGITCFFAIAVPGSVSISGWIKSLLPVTAKYYWYITEYVGMFLFIPFLNTIIQNSEQRQVVMFSIALTVLVLVMPLLPTINDPYVLNTGYSTFWLCILYLLGGWIKKYHIPQRIKRFYALIIFIASTILVLISKIVLEIGITHFLGSYKPGNTLIYYTSPFILINGIALLCFFARTEFKAYMVKNSIRVFSPAALGVYLIHAHPIIWNNVMRECAAFFANYNPLCLGLSVLGFGVAIYLGCSLIELVRLKLFVLLNIPQKLKTIDEKISKVRFIKED